MGFLAYNNALLGATFTGTGFSAQPPISNLGTPQTPSPHAEFTGATASFDVTFASTEVGMLALIGLDIADGATITWKRTDATTIVSVTHNRFKNRPNNHYALITPETLTSLACEITNAGSGVHRVAAAWASPVLIGKAPARWQDEISDQGSVTRVGGTAWPFADARLAGTPVELERVEYPDAYGVASPTNPGPAGLDVRGILAAAGNTSPVIWARRDSSAEWIASTAIYGLLTGPIRLEHTGGPFHALRARILEQA